MSFTWTPPTTDNPVSFFPTVDIVTLVSPQRPGALRRVREVYGDYLCLICSATGHLDGCLLLNSRGAGRGGRLWHRFVSWCLMA